MLGVEFQIIADLRMIIKPRGLEGKGCDEIAKINDRGRASEHLKTHEFGLSAPARETIYPDSSYSEERRIVIKGT
jgi:hypothetical protein